MTAQFSIISPDWEKKDTNVNCMRDRSTLTGYSSSVEGFETCSIPEQDFFKVDLSKAPAEDTLENYLETWVSSVSEAFPPSLSRSLYCIATWHKRGF